MSNILLILFFIALAFIKIVLSGKGVGETEDDEAFPEVDILEPVDAVELPDGADSPSPARSDNAPLSLLPEEDEEPAPVVSDDIIMAADEQPSEETICQPKRLRFKDKSEIKRAVLYSEILHNKYNC